MQTIGFDTSVAINEQQCAGEGMNHSPTALEGYNNASPHTGFMFPIMVWSISGSMLHVFVHAGELLSARPNCDNNGPQYERAAGVE